MLDSAMCTSSSSRSEIHDLLDNKRCSEIKNLTVRGEDVDSVGVLRRLSSLSHIFLKIFMSTAHWIKGADCTVQCARHCATWGVVGCSRRVFERGSGFDGGRRRLHARWYLSRLDDSNLSLR